MKKDVLQPKNFVMLTIAGLINAFGVTCFLYPVNLYDSGISGTSMLLAQVTLGYLSLSVFLLLLNFPLFLYGYKKMGISFTLYSVYAVFVYSMGTWIITDILPVDVTIASPLAEQDLLLCAIFGGLISGMMKRIRMEKAQQQIDELRGSLERFNSELKDVQVQCSASAELSEWLSITDLVFDDPLSDWLSLSKIKDAKAEIDRTAEEVTALLAKLEGSRGKLRQS